MSKIAIVSRPDQHLLLDISGCVTFKETIEQLSSALLSANQFWQGLTVDLSLGNILLNRSQIAQIIALTKGVGINPKHIFSLNPRTLDALKELEGMLDVGVIEGHAAQLSSVSMLPPEETYSLVSQEMVETEKNDSGQSESKQVDATFERVVMLETAENPPQMAEDAPVSLPTAEAPPNSQKSDQSGQESANKEELALLLAANQVFCKTSNQQSLYIKQTLRAGQAVSHNGDLIIIGDVNAGAEVLAEGDITVWGTLRGIAHAGVGGNLNAEIRALRLQPIQIRIAHLIARSPDAPHVSHSAWPGFMAETAKLVDGKIRILRETFD